MINNKGTITLSEACKLLNRSRKTLGKYIKEGKLKPERVLSKRGTLQYHFRKADLDRFIISGKDKKEEKRREETGKDNDVISLLKDTMQALKRQLKVKDIEIDNLSKRIDKLIEEEGKSKNIITGMASRLFLLEDKTKDENRGERREEKRREQGLNGFFKRLFKRTN